jgi:TPR repeat protein
MTKDFLNIRSGLKILPFCFVVMLSPTLVSANECVDQHGAKNYKQALITCQKMAATQDVSALFTLGLMHFYGQAVPQSQSEAFGFFKRAARLGHAGAQNNLGYFYYNGVVVKQDYVRAFLWFSLSAAEGFTEASSFRDAAAGYLNKDQILQAQAMAQACKNSRYEMCE